MPILKPRRLPSGSRNNSIPNSESRRRSWRERRAGERSAFFSMTSLPEEGYRLRIEPRGVTIAGRPAGLFYGAQSVLQLAAARSGTTFDSACGRNPGSAAISLSRPAPGYVAPHVPGRVSEALSGLDGALQAEHIPLASHGRSRLAHRDQAIPAADGSRLDAEGDAGRTLAAIDHLRRKAVRRILHAGADPRRGGLRARTVHHRDSGDRDAGPLAGRAGGVSGAGVHAGAVRDRDHVGRIQRRLLPQGEHLSVPGKRADRGHGAVPFALHPHRRRRSPERTAGRKARMRRP